MMGALIDLAYLISAVLFIVGLKRLASPVTARQGNFVSAVGMLIAIGATALDQHILSFRGIIIGVIIGSALGAWMARTVKMTAMPQMVALLNGFGGGASLLVAAAEWSRLTLPGAVFSGQTEVSIYASTLIGGVTFTGSVVAFAKLQEWLPGRPLLFPLQHWVNLAIALAIIAGSTVLTLGHPSANLFLAVNAAALLLGVLLVIPIGGADMPVVISLLNSYSGLAGATTGFVIGNHGLIITGALVGASGIILTQIMCKAMNRSLANVLFATMGPTADTPDADEVYKTVKATSPEEIAMMLDGAQRVVIVPGYGMAVAQAQHAVRQLEQLLEAAGTHVEYAVHPVAGRMPGHMNVLLAEADVDYDKLREMDDINPELEQVDVCIVVGANDVVNPVARTDPKSPIAGMPIIDVDKAHTVIVIKRSLSPGFAGIPNPLFANDNTLMFFSDGKKAVQDIVAAVKEAA
jgi:NAD(P) transhydrogenase subunit beta